MKAKKQIKKIPRNRDIHQGCGGNIKTTLGHGKKYGSMVCVKCGVFFD